MKLSILCVSTLPGTVLAHPASFMMEKRDGMTANVDLSSNLGSPTHFASGFIYGILDTPDQIPDHWYENMGFNYGKAGGAQLNAPSRGWIWNELDGRFQSTLSNYNTCRKYGAAFIILPHDVWGTDHANSSTIWPGDDGDFTNYDEFIQSLMSNLKANNTLDGLVWDIWNEPDSSGFWPRFQQQLLDLYTTSIVDAVVENKEERLLLCSKTYCVVLSGASKF